MNSRENFTNGGMVNPNHTKVSAGRSDFSGANPIPYNKPKSVSEEISEINIFDNTPSQKNDGTRIFNSVRQDSSASVSNVSSGHPKNSHFHNAGNIGFSIDDEGTTRLSQQKEIVGASHGYTINRQSSNPVPTPNTLRTAPENKISNASSDIANPTRIMPANRPNGTPVVTDSNVTRVIPAGTSNSAQVANNNPTRIMPTTSINNGTSTYADKNATRIMPATGSITGANVSSIPNNKMNVGSQVRPGTASIGTSSPVSNAATAGAVIGASGTVRSATPSNVNNTTRVIPRTVGVNGHAPNNSTTRIMPGIPANMKSTPGYNPANAPKPGIAPTSESMAGTINSRTVGDPNSKTTIAGNIPSKVNGGKTAVMPSVHLGTSETKTPPSDSSSKKRNKPKKSGNPWVGVLKFFLYIIFVIVISILLAKYFISVGNDVFAFVKDSYNFTDTIYSVKGETTNAFRVTESELSGDKFEFNYAFKNPLTQEELDALDASCMLINTSDNSVVHNYGKYTDDVSKGNPIVIDLSNGDMEGDIYVLRFTVNTGNNISHITEFTLNKKNVNVNIKQNASVSDVAKALKANGIIKHPAAFKLYINIKTDDDEKMEFVAGSHTLYLGMDYDEIISAITPKRNARSIVKLTFPEGSTVDDIIDILIKGGVKNSKQDYIDAMNRYADFDYRFINLLEERGFPSDRVYPLEGYLFPDTYEFYTDASPEAVLDKFLSNFNTKFDTSFYDEAERLGLSIDEILTIASLVETEAGNPDDKANISSVFHNRINKASEFPYLESDATTDYASYDLKSDLKLTDYKCSKCGEKDVKSHTKCSKCGNNNSYEVYKCASFNMNLSKYNLIDGTYYINFNVRTDTTRSVALIDINKKTSGDNVVYTITSKNVSDTPTDGDLKFTIVNASIDANNVLSCEFKLDHDFTSEAFMKFPIKLNLFRKAYNTYLTPGIMPSAVANPGYDSIIAALYPNSTNYYFFVADNAGNSHFSTTNEEHNATIAELERDGRSVTAN